MASRIERYVPVIQAFGTRGILFHTAIAKCFGLTITEFNCFRLAARPGGVTATDLARETGLTLPAMTAIVDRLVAMDFVSRARDTEDRRRVIISVRKKAWTQVSGFYASHSMQVAKILDSFSDDQFEFLLRYMQDVEQMLQNQLILLAEEAKRRSPEDNSPQRARSAGTGRGKPRSGRQAAR